MAHRTSLDWKNTPYRAFILNSPPLPADDVPEMGSFPRGSRVVVGCNRFCARRGVAAVYTVMMMVALFGLVSLGVDLGRVYVAKSELQTAADAAARAAAAKIGKGAAACRAEALDAADDNTADGAAVMLQNADVEFGAWDSETRTFTPASGSAENTAAAVRVTARKLAARGTAVPLTFGSLVGKSTCDVRAVAVAVGPKSGKLGIIGISNVTLDSNARIDSYDSSAGAYSSGSVGSSGNVYSNGDIVLKSNSYVAGDARPGPGGSATGGTVTGSRSPSSTTTTYPPVDGEFFRTSNDNALIPAAYRPGADFLMDGNSVLNLPAGTYYFRNFTMLSDSRINVTGPATVYVTGAFTLDSNARIGVARTHDFRVNLAGPGPVTINSNSIFTGILYAPQAAVDVDSNSQIFGAVVAKTLHLDSYARVHFDESLNSGPGSQSLRLVY